MNWYNYIAIFFAGAFLVNAVPHFIKGISGDKFPTPFAKPPGKGLSSPMVNTLWGGLNLVIGYLLFKGGKTDLYDCTDAVIFFIGIMAMAIMLSSNFEKKDKE